MYPKIKKGRDFEWGERAGHAVGPLPFPLFRKHVVSEFRNCHKNFLLPMAQQPLVGQGLLIIEALRSHSDTPHSVGLLWMSDQPDAETSTWQHIIFTRDTHSSGRIRTHNPSKRTAADPRFRRHGDWHRPGADVAYAAGRPRDQNSIPDRRKKLMSCNRL
jgi:hypothetical protein